MRIEEATETVGGHPVRVYATDGDPSGRVVHGAIWSGTGWRLSKWDRNGRALDAPGLESNFDLDLTDWRDEIPWSCLQDWVLYVAKDYNGKWFAYGDLPFVDGPTWCGGPAHSLSSVKMPQGPDDWTQTLAARPGTEEDSFF